MAPVVWGGGKCSVVEGGTYSVCVCNVEQSVHTYMPCTVTETCRSQYLLCMMCGCEGTVVCVHCKEV